MNTSGDAAESIIRMSLQGIEVAARISGSGAKNVAVLLCAILKEQEKVKGKTKLVNMLKSGKELKVFSVKYDDLKKFTEEAKREIYTNFNRALVDQGILFVGSTEQIIMCQDFGLEPNKIFFYQKNKTV